MTDAYIYDAIRTPRGKGRADGSLHEVTALRLSADTLNALKARNGTAADAVEDVIWGNVTQVGEQGGCLARSAVLLSDLDQKRARPLDQPLLRQRARGGEPRREPGRGGAGDGYIAGGVEMMSRVPMGSDGAAIAVDPSLAMKTYFVPQGISADIIATEYGFSRDDCDASPSRARSARRRPGRRAASRSSVVPVSDVNGLPILDRDEHMRPRHRHAVARRAQAVVQGHRRDHARLRRGGDPEVPAPRADQPRPPRRQLVAASSTARRRC